MTEQDGTHADPSEVETPTTKVRFFEGGDAFVRIPQMIVLALGLVDGAQLCWSELPDGGVRVAICPADEERVRAIREAEDAAMIAGIEQGLGAIPDYPLDET